MVLVLIHEKTKTELGRNKVQDVSTERTPLEGCPASLLNVLRVSWTS